MRIFVIFLENPKKNDVLGRFWAVCDFGLDGHAADVAKSETPKSEKVKKRVLSKSG